jgi:hypothetical protein
MRDFNVKTDTQEADLGTAMQVVYQWNYDSEVEELRNLYVKAAEAQWIGTTDVDWEQPLDLVKFSTTPLGTGIPIEQTSYWRSLPERTTTELVRRTAAFRLSQFLHGEQGALMVAAQLVNAVPHTDAKFYAATQTMDEARHVEVFARYIQKLDHIQPIAPSLKGLLDTTLETGDWMKKLVGMQIVVEGLALYAFREMRTLTEEPLLKEILTYVGRDESRHHAYGVQYIERCVPCLGARERAELEDFALECARSLIDRNAQGLFTSLLQIWTEVGIDPQALFESVSAEREAITRDLPSKRRLGPVQGFVIPTLKRCGLLSERVATHYHGFLRENFGARTAGEDVHEFLERLPDLPEDTLRWVMGELQ